MRVPSADEPTTAHFWQLHQQSAYWASLKRPQSFKLHGCIWERQIADKTTTVSLCVIQCCHCNIIKTESPATESETTHKRLQRQLLKSFMGMPSCRRSPRIAQLHASSSSCSCHIRKHTVTRDSLTSLVHIAKRIKPCMDRRQSTKRSETSPRVDRPGPEPGTRWFELYLTRAEWFAVNGEGYWRVILINLIVVKVNSVICLMNLHPSSPELCL